MHKIAESPTNTGFLRLCIYTFRYFEKEKQKINSLKISGFQCDFKSEVVRRISRKDYLVKAMLRCFCLPAKRCTFVAMSLRQ